MTDSTTEKKVRHSEGAIRATEEILYYLNGTHQDNEDSRILRSYFLEIIDRETNVKELVEALAWALDSLNGLPENIKNTHGGIHSAIKSSRLALGIPKNERDSQ